MPRLVKYAMSVSSFGSARPVGPPCTCTTYGGSSPSGAVKSGLDGGYTYAGISPNTRSTGTGRYASSSDDSPPVRYVSSPLDRSRRTTEYSDVGPAAPQITT